MNDAYRLLVFIIIPMLIAIGYLMPSEVEVTICKLDDRITYINQREVSEDTVAKLGLGSCEQLVMKREDYYKLRNSKSF